MLEKQKIDPLERDRILALEEGAYLDFKNKAISPAKLSRTISAFANTSGGELFIGISEEVDQNKKKYIWDGLADIETANPIFQILEKMSPVGGHYKASLLQCNGHGGYVLHLLIFKTKEILYATDSKPYIRRGAQNLSIESNDSLKRLELDKGIVSFEDNTLDINLSNITNSKTVLSFIMNVLNS